VSALTVALPAHRRSVASRVLPRRLRHLVVVVTTPVVALLASWWVFLALIHTSPLIAKTPIDVWRELTSDPDAAATRSVLISGLWTTLGHSFVGLAAGTVAACVLAAAVTTSQLAAVVVRPVAVGLTCVPTVAFAPLLILIFPRGVIVVAMIGGLVTMVPTLYYLLEGLRSVSPQLVDAIRVGGGRRREVLVYAQLPTAVPALALSLRIAAPGAIIGALLSEWLATGDGLGLQMILGQSTFHYGLVWAATFLVTVIGMAMYGAAVVVESRLISRWAPDRDGSEVG
jgi:ABC-type nitrate/sulfonate/bicarbonate transport system permease component